MEKVLINRTNYGIQRDNILSGRTYSVYTDNAYLYFIIDGFYQIKAGDYIMFDRFVSAEGYDNNVPVSSKKKVVIYAKYLQTENKTIIAVNAEEKTLLRIQESGITDSGSCYVTEFETPTNVFAQDVVFAKNKGLSSSIQTYNPQTNEFTDIADIYFYETNSINGKKNYQYITSACCPAESFIYNRYNQVDYNDCNQSSVNPSGTPMYDYLPYKTSSNILSFTIDLSAYTGQNLFYKYNSFYCQSNSVTTVNYDILSGLSLYECYFWEDVSGNGDRAILREDGSQIYNNILIDKIIDFWGISVGLTSNNDYTHLYQEQNITELYVNSIRNRVIAGTPVIDMEKMKYSPYYEEDKYYPITSITYNLHFRQRNLEDGEWGYVDDDEAFWNPKILEESGETSGSTGLTPEELESSDAVFSDMLYYLGFTDNDVMNQKQKIRKSFLRLSFYDSPDPLTQKLIYYSSIFMDSGELFGRYIKAKNELVKAGESGDNVVLNSQESEKYRLDCRFIVKNEYNTIKSSDGFNIYYFPDNVPEISGKTIYMKVEFNHAGYGRTIPMIAWPDSGLTMDAIKDGALYMPLKLKNISEEENVNNIKGFAYILEENDFIKRENNTLIFNLVEPKLIENGNN